MKTLQTYIDKLNKLNFKEMYNNDFFLTWEKTDDELEAEAKEKAEAKRSLSMRSKSVCRN